MFCGIFEVFVYPFVFMGLEKVILKIDFQNIFF